MAIKQRQIPTQRTQEIDSSLTSSISSSIPPTTKGVGRRGISFVYFCLGSDSHSHGGDTNLSSSRGLASACSDILYVECRNLGYFFSFLGEER